MTTQNSTQYAAQTSNPPTTAEVVVSYAKVRYFRVNFTQTGVGSDGSTARLIKLPAGKIAYLQHLSRFKVSAMGSGRTLDFGWAEYRDQDRAVVTASPDGIHTDADVAAASEISPGDALADGVKVFESFGGVTLTATIDNGTIPNAATIQGIVAIAVE